MNFTSTTRVKATPEMLFNACTDFAGAADRITGIKRVEMLTEGPTRVGTRFRETRIMMKKEATETLEVVALEPGKSVTVGARSCGVDYRSTFEFRPAAGGTTDLVFTMNSRAITLGAKVFAPIMGALMGGMMKKLIAQDIADIKKAVESGA